MQRAKTGLCRSRYPVCCSIPHPTSIHSQSLEIYGIQFLSLGGRQQFCHQVPIGIKVMEWTCIWVLSPAQKTMGFPNWMTNWKVRVYNENSQALMIQDAQVQVTCQPLLMALPTINKISMPKFKLLYYIQVVFLIYALIPVNIFVSIHIFLSKRLDVNLIQKSKGISVLFTIKNTIAFIFSFAIKKKIFYLVSFAFKIEGQEKRRELVIVC